MPLRPITKVYQAFDRAGRGEEPGTVKEEFLTRLRAGGIDLERMTVARLALILRGKLRIEELRKIALGAGKG
jgi:hypothetical protein